MSEEQAKIKVTAAKVHDDLKIIVENTELILSEIQIKEIFQDITRIQKNITGAEKSKDHSMGMWISRNIIQAMGGSLDVQSSEVSGTKYILSVPIGLN